MTSSSSNEGSASTTSYPSGRRVTRKDVAQLAGVSVATVSYVINDLNKVPETTAQRVRSAIRRLGYRPDMVARSLATKRTNQMAIVINNISNPIYSDLILGFENQAIREGFFVSICTGHTHVDDYIENFIDRRIDGIFLEALPHKYHRDEIERLLEADVRIVIFGRTDLDLRRVSSVETDYEVAMGLAVDHLVELGHRSIAYISGLTEEQAYDRRISAFRTAVKRHGIEANQGRVVLPPTVTNTEIADGMVGVQRLLKSPNRPTAVVCTNDLMAVGAIRQLNQEGYRVPDDVSVVGLDDSYIATVATPHLTTISVPYHDVGRRAFDLLLADVKDNTKGYFRIQPELVVRDSTAPVSGTAATDDPHGPVSTPS